MWKIHSYFVVQFTRRWRKLGEAESEEEERD